MIWPLFLINTALAWVPQTNPFTHCDGWVAGTQSTYHIVDNEFQQWQIDAIDEAADAWAGGPGELLRGVDHKIVRGANETNYGELNFKNEVFDLHPADFNPRGVGDDVIAYNSKFWNPFACAPVAQDVVFQEIGPNMNWVGTLTSQTNHGAGELSMGDVALHEFGHWVGLDHQIGHARVMQPYYPNGDISAQLRVHEDDYDGYAHGKPGASTGKNLMVSKFLSLWPGTVSSGNAFEVWDGEAPFNGPQDGGPSWYGCPGETLPFPPAPINLEITGTVASVTPTVRWVLSGTLPCWDGVGEYTVGEATPGLSVGLPYERQLTDFTLPIDIPPGDYFLCAKIDPDGLISETSESDNSVRSERLFGVLDPASPSCN